MHLLDRCCSIKTCQVMLEGTVLGCVSIRCSLRWPRRRLSGPLLRSPPGWHLGWRPSPPCLSAGMGLAQQPGFMRGEANTRWGITYSSEYLCSITSEQTPLSLFERGKKCDGLSEPQKNGPKVAERGEEGEIREEMDQRKEQDEWQAERDLTTICLFVF